MKIDGITLLQMIKDKKIKENTLIEVSGGFRTHYPYVKFGKNKRLYWENEHYTINQVVLTDDLLEYEFEIIEEIEKPKKIEKWNYEVDKFNDSYYDTALIALAKQNEDLRKAVNYLLEKSNKDE